MTAADSSEPQFPDTSGEDGPAYQLYERAGAAFDANQLDAALQLFLQSWNVSLHFKTAERIGECYAKLGKHADAIPYLAAAALMNRGARAPGLLARTFADVGEIELALEMAELALKRQPQKKKIGELVAELGRRADGRHRSPSSDAI